MGTGPEAKGPVLLPTLECPGFPVTRDLKTRCSTVSSCSEEHGPLRKRGESWGDLYWAGISAFLHHSDSSPSALPSSYGSGLPPLFNHYCVGLFVNKVCIVLLGDARETTDTTRPKRPLARRKAVTCSCGVAKGRAALHEASCLSSKAASSSTPQSLERRPCFLTGFTLDSSLKWAILRTFRGHTLGPHIPQAAG